MTKGPYVIEEAAKFCFLCLSHSPKRCLSLKMNAWYEGNVGEKCWISEYKWANFYAAFGDLVLSCWI